MTVNQHSQSRQKTLQEIKPHRSKALRWLFIFLGLTSTLLGTIGIFVPLLPTTPLLLLAAYLFARSSKRFYLWLLYNRFFGMYLRNYIEKKGIPLKLKVLTLTLLWLTIGYSVIAVTDSAFIRIFLLIIALGVNIHILKIPGIKKPSGKESR